MLEPGHVFQGQKGQQWEIIDRLGGGQCTQVYQCRHLTEGFKAALKVYKEGPRYQAAFYRELQLLQAVHHKKPARELVEVLDHGRHEGRCVMVMELLEPSLPQVVMVAEEQGGLSLYLLHTLLCDVLKALELLHSCGFVHADLKSDNVLWCPQKAVFKVIDLGLTFHIEDQEVGVVQSPNYRAPEAWSRSEAGEGTAKTGLTAAIDIWSLGALTVWLFTRHRLSKPLTYVTGMCNSCKVPDSTERCESVVQAEALLGSRRQDKDPQDFQNFKDLVLSLLPCDPKLRPTVTELLSKPFCKKPIKPSFTDLLVLPTPVVCLINILSSVDLSSDEEYEEICEDIQEECEKIGAVEKLVVPRTGPAKSKAFVQYTHAADAQEAFAKLNARVFADHTIITTYFPLQDFLEEHFY